MFGQNCCVRLPQWRGVKSRLCKEGRLGSTGSEIGIQKIGGEPHPQQCKEVTDPLPEQRVGKISGKLLRVTSGEERSYISNPQSRTSDQKPTDSKHKAGKD